MPLLNRLQNLSPWMYPILGFLVLILSGTLALLLIPTHHGTHLSAIDALFTATSATCVTGLIVVDTGKDLSFWGQVTVLALIQSGGLGIMIFSSLLLLALGRSIPFRSRFVVEETYSHTHRADLYFLIRNVVVFTFLFEGAGAILLFLRFQKHFDPTAALYRSVFHSVSAFCNAGFALFSDSFMSYREDTLVNLTLAGLIIIGGLGFAVLHELLPHRWILSQKQENRPLLHSWTHYWNRLSLHTKIVLSVTLFLLLGGTVFFAACEWHNTLRGLPVSSKILAAFFQSVTTRTAGFNTLDFGVMNNITLLGTILLMFIGASPGSTGGGIKTSTVGVLLVLSRARLKGTNHVYAFKRSLSPLTKDRAFSICTLSMVIIFFALALLLISEVSSPASVAGRELFLELLFETTSAFATVGLSMGITSDLSTAGKFILVLIMFTGRLGPLAIATAIQSTRGEKGTFFYAEESVMIG